MAENADKELIIVRRYEAEEESHKGGVWKIAHADFMTAMMAFFLIMWLIGAADNNTRTSIANYFNPVQLADSTTNRKGLRDPNSTTSSEDREGETKKGSQTEGTQGTKNGGSEKESPAQQTQKPRYKEGALFQDPYAILAKLAEAEQEKPQDTLGADVPLGESGEPGLDGGEAYRDPFDPMYWQVAPVPTPKSDKPGQPRTATPVPPDGRLDALAPASQDQPEVPPNGKTVGEKPGVKAASQGSGSAAGNPPKAGNTPEAEIKAEIAKALELSTDSNPKPHVEVTKVGEGVLISITDEINFSMFAIGSAEPQPKVVRSMEKIAKILSSKPGKIVIRGHTDGRPFKSETYDNWRLSTARAHMAYYMLVRGGVDEKRIERVEGHADRSLKNAADPNAAENRRIEILLRERS